MEIKPKDCRNCNEEFMPHHWANVECDKCKKMNPEQKYFAKWGRFPPQTLHESSKSEPSWCFYSRTEADYRTQLADGFAILNEEYY